MKKEMQVDYNIWNLFIRTLSPPLNTYKSFAKYESQSTIIQRARNIQRVQFSRFLLHQGLDNLASYLKSTAESIATKQKLAFASMSSTISIRHFRHNFYSLFRLPLLR